jgi:hypothetical protein
MDTFDDVRDSEQAKSTIQTYKSKLNLIATVIYKLEPSYIEFVDGERANMKDVLKVRNHNIYIVRAIIWYM